MESRVDSFIANPKKALRTLAYPIAVGFLVQALYNIVDTIWVGRLGADSIAALTFAFPLFFLLISINSGIGTGMGAGISRYLGAKNRAEAENMADHGVVLSLIFALVFFTIGWFALVPVFRLFGATDSVLPLSLSYMRIVLIGVFFMFPSFVMNSLFTSQVDSNTPVSVQIAALILNAILDPIFIYTFGMGVAGAAIATDIAFAFSLTLLTYYLYTKSHVRLNVHRFKWHWKYSWEIMRVGTPAAGMLIMMSIYIVFINRFMAHFGTEYVAAFGIVSRLETFALFPIIAISLSLLTLVGMFYGAKRYDLMRRMIWYGIKTSLVFTGIAALIFFVFARHILWLFTDSASLLEVSILYLRVDVFTFPLLAFAINISRALQAIGKGLPGLVIQVVRIFVVAVPCAYLFVYHLGYGFLSVAFAMVLGGIAACAVGLVWMQASFKRVPEVGDR
jgi:putative MATE family efflux protein